MPLINPLPPRIWRVTLDLGLDSRSFDFTSDEEVTDFLLVCRQLGVPYTMTHSTPATAARAAKWLDRNLNHGA